MPAFVEEEDRQAGPLVRILPRWTVMASEVFLLHRDPVPRDCRDIVTEILRQRPLG